MKPIGILLIAKEVANWGASPNHKTPTVKEIKKVVLHELIHVLLWDWDSFCEQKIAPEDRGQYFELLEAAVGDLSEKIAQL